jgi:hypothetical protein
MLWSNGEEHPREAFAFWGSPWRQGYACNDRNSIAVVYLDPNKGGRWFAHDKDKEYTTYFVEYPTGKP